MNPFPLDLDPRIQRDGDTDHRIKLDDDLCQDQLVQKSKGDRYEVNEYEEIDGLVNPGHVLSQVQEMLYEQRREYTHQGGRQWNAEAIRYAVFS